MTTRLDRQRATREPSLGSFPRQLGRYQIVRRLPSDDARNLFLATDGPDEADAVVLEVLAAPQRSKGLLSSRIAEEATAYASLSHPNVVRVVDLFLTDASFVIALEHVDGAPLEQMRDAAADLPREQVDACWIHVACRMLDALAAAHGAVDAAGDPAPLLHRRVNPSNVQIAWDGTVKLGHFDVGDVTSALRPSNPALARRALAYLAPEQIKMRQAVPASDVYSTMLVLWELLAGRRAIDAAGPSPARPIERLTSPNIVPLEKLRPDLDARVLEAVRIGLLADPRARTMTAAHARDLLRGVIDERDACHIFVDAIGHLRAAQQADTVAPPPSHERLRIPEEVRLTPPPLPTGIHIGPPPLPARARVTPPPLPLHSKTATTLPPTPMPTVTPPPPAPAGDAPIVPSTAKLPARLGALVAIAAAACVVVLAALAPLPRAGRGDVAPGQPAQIATPAPPVATQAPAAAEAPPGAEAPVVAEAPAGSTAPAAEAIPPDVGELLMPAYAAQHRVYVDDRVVSEGTAPVRVKCGTHVLRIGSAGKDRHTTVPCGRSLQLR